MRALDLRQVEVFYYVAKFRSFSKAAEALLLTQPTISGHIKTLEESLALVLFDRLGR
jgi:DNA-binding transcriptional LysR family regulator